MGILRRRYRRLRMGWKGGRGRSYKGWSSKGLLKIGGIQRSLALGRSDITGSLIGERMT